MNKNTGWILFWIAGTAIQGVRYSNNLDKGLYFAAALEFVFLILDAYLLLNELDTRYGRK